MNATLTKRTARLLAAAFASAFCLGCWAEDKLSGTPADLPPGTLTPAPPLELSPADLAKISKAKGKKPRP
ncbi:hypothetical protein [Paludisphaera mucosa]|uniref:Uncharacterized protein n=1 Tax=Paludisphaera mucosa TaxID=3030827 RepID=A0ABT6FGW5_9BACT|nr:hypothetical protein [Paludisphaera mucosa]MDG3006828.1 hypothetical protein [Paludisphaera mucosa]